MTYTKDIEQGWLVHQRLLRVGVETPFKQKKIDKVNLEYLFSRIMEETGLDLRDDSLNETPRRLAKLYSDEYFAGLNYDNFPKATVVDNKFNYDEMLLERNVAVNSLCAPSFIRH